MKLQDLFATCTYNNCQTATDLVRPTTTQYSLQGRVYGRRIGPPSVAVTSIRFFEQYYSAIIINCILPVAVISMCNSLVFYCTITDKSDFRMCNMFNLTQRYGSRSFRVSGPTVWNSLPRNLYEAVTFPGNSSSVDLRHGCLSVLMCRWRV